MANKDTIFKSTKPEDKAQRINDAARAIISAEDDARRSKTERLRAARLEREAKEGDAPEAKPASKRKPAAKRAKTFKV
jgi:hypothetical protein